MSYGLMITDGRVTVSSRTVAENYGKLHKHVLAKIDGYIKKIPKLNGTNFRLVKYQDAKGEERREYEMDRQGFSILVNKFTGDKALEFTIKYAQAFEQMIEKIKNEHAIPFENQLAGTKFIADDLRVNESSRILMYNKVCKANGVSTDFLPNYTEEKVTKSATELLKQFNVGVATKKFNILLIDGGYLEEKTRPSSKKGGKDKKYKQLIDKGLEYGKNLISPHNQKEVQPHYYEDTFMELVNRVLN